MTIRELLRRFEKSPRAKQAARSSPGGADVPALAEIRADRGAKGVSFPVDSVTPAAVPILTETLAESLAQRLQRNILVLPGAQELVINADPIVDKRRGMRRIPRRLSHPLIDAVHTAFSQHRPLTLSPDAIWLVIAQGFGHHVAENAEELRRRLVRHKGKHILRVKTQDLTLSSFEDAVASFSELIRREIDPVLHETLMCDFSTTNSTIRTASEVALMDTFSSYFAYALTCVCGIPRITIEGTLDDWQRIRARIEVLATYGLEWWVCRLRTILDEFVRAAEGRPNQEFWKAIYKPKSAYAQEMVTGWMADLFPYLGDPPERRRNPLYESDQRNWAAPIDYSLETRFYPVFNYSTDSGVSTASFPSGVSSARVKVSLPDKTETELDLLGGIMAVKQDTSDLALSPLISWCAAGLPPEKPVTVF
jgi:Domain of unknown function (DUF4419)